MMKKGRKLVFRSLFSGGRVEKRWAVGGDVQRRNDEALQRSVVGGGGSHLGGYVKNKV